MPPYAVAGLTNLCTAKIKTMLDSIACRKVKDHTYFVNCKDVQYLRFLCFLNIFDILICSLWPDKSWVKTLRSTFETTMDQTYFVGIYNL